MKTVQVRNITLGEGRPKICVPIVGQTKDDILLEAGTFARIPVDVVEWRVDWGRAVSTVEKINTRTSSHAVLYDLADLDQLKKEMADSYIFVNATGVGMKPLEGQSVVVPDKSYFRPELIVVDVPYSPLETAMRSMAKEVGCKTMNGLGMMLFQGSAAFELWTGEPMPIEHMKEILNIRYDD